MMFRPVARAMIAALVLAPLAARAADALPAAKVKAAIERMKTSARGPFERIRWFCVDGSVLPPQPYACAEHGGGSQHGEWSATTTRIRAAGYPIANVLADVDPAVLIGDPIDWDALTGLLLEQFLIAADDGWIMRQARSYRGALQSESESGGATRLLEAMLRAPLWTERHYLLLREAARLLPLGEREPLLSAARTLASRIAEQDPGFVELRNKIHSRPDAGDAARVRRYAAQLPVAALPYAELADDLAKAFDRSDTPGEMRALAKAVGSSELATHLEAAADVLGAGGDPAARLEQSAIVLEQLRETLPQLATIRLRKRALLLTMALELDAFSAGRELAEGNADATRAQRLQWLRETARVLYGTGLLSAPEWREVQLTLRELEGGTIALRQYRDALGLLGRTPAWAGARLGFYFGPIVERFGAVEPISLELIPDRLRGSPLLVFAAVLDMLTSDADRLAGVSQQLFGAAVGSGLRELNPGLARGRLHAGLETGADADANGIYLVPETTADLPPVAGILTAAEGNALSHVQLLARNLGIPNVVVAASLLPQVTRARGEPVVLAASPGGIVQLARDGPQWDDYFARDAVPDTVIHVDVGKLDLARTDLIPSSELQASDSGRIVGPKAAQVGELTRRFPGHVAPALAIPFGVFRNRLQGPAPEGNGTLIDWMRAGYATLASLRDDPAEQARQRERFLNRLRTAITTEPLDTAWLAALRRAMTERFGPDGSYGVFVRSDTNVEDLPGFTGAGLNLTVPNVVGFDHVADAIRAVWASPFSDRAFAWRQALMDSPEHVYASVLLHLSVPSDKSGVMVTADLATGSRAAISVVVNEGVGGGVDNQYAETLRIDLASGAVRRLASATAPYRRELDPAGGLRQVRASGRDRVLEDEEIAQLIALARDLPQRYPQLVDAAGEPAPADIEFGFVGGQLRLFQIRPFLQSRAAQRNRYLAQLDEALAASAALSVALDAPPADTQEKQP